MVVFSFEMTCGIEKSPIFHFYLLIPYEFLGIFSRETNGLAVSARAVSDEEGPTRDSREGIEEQPVETRMTDGSSIDLSQSRHQDIDQPTDMLMQLEDSKDSIPSTVEKISDDKVSPSTSSLSVIKDIPSVMTTTETHLVPAITSSHSPAQLQRTHVLFDPEHPFFYDVSSYYPAALTSHSTDTSVWGPPELTDDWYIDEVEHASLVPICKWTLRKHATRMDTSATTVKTLPSAARYDTSPLVSRKLLT